MTRKFFCSILACCLIAQTAIKAGHDSASFELQKGFIIIDAIIDGDSGTFILDSGAPGLVLNSRRIDSEGVAIAAKGTGGSIAAQILSDRDFQWSSFDMQNISAISIDLSYLETSLDREITGLVGIDLFKGYDVLIDYGSQTVHIGDAACCAPGSEYATVLPLEIHDHVMTVSMKYGNKTLRFGIDTGSPSNLLCARLLKSFESCDVTELNIVKLVGADQTEITTKKIRLQGLTAEGNALGATDFVLQDMTGLSRPHLKLHGLLGQNFFGASKVWITKERDHLIIEKTGTSLIAGGN